MQKKGKIDGEMAPILDIPRLQVRAESYRERANVWWEEAQRLFRKPGGIRAAKNYEGALREALAAESALEHARRLIANGSEGGR